MSTKTRPSKPVAPKAPKHPKSAKPAKRPPRPKRNELLVIVRHAHRDKPLGGAFDNGLSDKGRDQAKRIARRYLKRFGHEECLLVSSPKKRCQETLEPLARSLDLPVEVFPSLDEGGDLQSKIESFFEWCHAQPARVIVACSHGDWIPEALMLSTGAMIEVDKGGWVEYLRDVEGYALKEVVQKP